jgi:hypothetical protein
MTQNYTCRRENKSVAALNSNICPDWDTSGTLQISTEWVIREKMKTMSTWAHSQVSEQGERRTLNL